MTSSRLPAKAEKKRSSKKAEFDLLKAVDTTRPYLVAGLTALQVAKLPPSYAAALRLVTSALGVVPPMAKPKKDPLTRKVQTLKKLRAAALAVGDTDPVKRAALESKIFKVIETL